MASLDLGLFQPLAIVLGFIVLASVPGCRAVCDGYAYGQCTSHLIRGDEGIDGFFYSMDALNKACSGYEKAAECMVDVLPDCHKDLQKKWKVEQDAFSYVCGSARLEYERFGSCFNRSDDWLVSDLAWCQRTKEDTLRVMHRSRWLAHHVNWVTCKMMRKYQTCITHSIVRRCSHTEARWQREVIHQLLLPQLYELKCR